MFVPSGASSSAQAGADALLTVGSFTTSGTSVTSFAIQARTGLASVQLSAPQGYGLSLADPVGTHIGFVFADLSDASNTLDGFVNAELRVDDPAKYAADASAQRCAPGTHAAVWRADLPVLGKTIPLPIFVDPGASSSGTSAVLRFCAAWPDVGIPGGLSSGDISIAVERRLTIPETPGRYTWSALVVPTHPGTSTAYPAGMFEVRAVVPQPTSLTLRAQHDPKSKSVQLTGKVTSVGEPEAGVEVSFVSLIEATDDISSFGPVLTNAAGEFRIRRPISRTTQFQAGVRPTLRPCSSPSTAPGGCVSETVTPPFGAQVRVRVPGPRDAKLVLKQRAQALARRINLRLTDFPAGWEATGQSFSFFPCRGFSPDLSRLTLNGDVESEIFVSDTAAAFSSVSVYANAAQARSAIARVGTLAAARCVAREIRSDGATVHRVGRASFSGLGGEVHAFRLDVSDEDGSGHLDLVWMRHGRVVTHVVVTAVADFPAEPEVLAKVAARARAG